MRAKVLLISMIVVFGFILVSVLQEKQFCSVQQSQENLNQEKERKQVENDRKLLMQELEEEGKEYSENLSVLISKNIQKLDSLTNFISLLPYDSITVGKDETVYGLSSPSAEEIRTSVPDLFPSLQNFEELGIAWETVTFYSNNEVISFTVLKKSAAGIGLTVFLKYHPKGEIVVPDYFIEVSIDGTECWKLYYVITEMGGM